MKYRKKPVVIEARQITRENRVEVSKWCNGELVNSTLNFVIPTLEGNLVACVGDYIIKGVKGEFYPCKSDIFEMTYEKVEERE